MSQDKNLTSPRKPVYLDNQASTPLDPRVLEAMMPYLTHKFGNPHSSSHHFGEGAMAGVEKARSEVASIIGTAAKEIYFTSGATEANNLALKGVLEYYSKLGKNHLIVSAIEHKCVLLSARYLESLGYQVTYLPVEPTGLVSLEKLQQALRPETALVSIIAVNNEIGVIQPLAEIGALCRKHSALFHTDAAQAVGKIDIDVNQMNIDLLSLSSHKIYGPIGIGALYIRRHNPRVRIVPQMHGGGQERGMRSGTLSPALCAGLGKACSLLKAEMHQDNAKIKELSDYFATELTKRLPKIYLNGDQNHKVPHNLNISFAGIEGESLILALEDTVAISTGSACSSASLEGSYVLKSLGIDPDLAHTSLRFGLSKFTTQEEIDWVIPKIVEEVERLRKMSPVWEMLEKGVDLKTIEWHHH